MTRFTPAAPVFAALFATAALAEGGGHWSYHGADGPDSWGAISKNFAECQSGNQQSPVDLAGGIAAAPAMAELHWNAKAQWQVHNTGHTVQVDGKKAGHITIAGKDYALLQFHFHHPSEHAVNGKRAAMEVHFVHQADDGALAVIGVLMTGGGENRAFDQIMATAPANQGKADLGAVDFQTLLPGNDRFFRYQGSLTTPPCSETVMWTVMLAPVSVSDQAIRAFAALFEMNARPLQMVNRRFILRG